jgi:excisionase family DNA binding protein
MNGEVTSKEAAELLHVSESRIRQFILENRFRSRKVGNTRLIKKADIMRLVAERQNKKAA